jgi:hypothetical protein
MHEQQSHPPCFWSIRWHAIANRESHKCLPRAVHTRLQWLTMRSAVMCFVACMKRTTMQVQSSQINPTHSDVCNIALNLLLCCSL